MADPFAQNVYILSNLTQLARVEAHFANRLMSDYEVTLVNDNSK